MSGPRLMGVRLADRPGLWDVLVEGDRISAVTAAGTGPGLAQSAEEVEGGGRLLIPGFVDGHTHACWHDATGEHRLDEWTMKRAGRPYLEILAAGGGIMATVRAVREATEAELAEQTAARLGRLLRNGTTTVEVKSGYGLTAEAEVKMLRAIRRASAAFPGTVVATALLGHAVDPDVPRERFIRATIEETLPRVSEEFPGIAVDAFCEEGAWTVEECRALFEAAQARGHPVRVHADQFTAQGMTPLAVSMGARSVDHLEASGPEDVAALAGSKGTYAVALPGCGHHLDGRFANLGPIAAAPGGAARCCLATNLNPGSSPCWSMGFVVSLGVRRCGLTPEQALAAATRNPARLLGLEDRGEVAVGRRADLVLVRSRSAVELAFGFGDAGVEAVWVGGRRVSG